MFVKRQVIIPPFPQGKSLLNVHTQQDKNLFMRSITTGTER